MSSILASLDMSLDDLISKKKQKPSNPDSKANNSKPKKAATTKQQGGAGPVRAGGRAQRSRRRNQPYARNRGGEAMEVDDMDEDFVPQEVKDSGRAGPKKGGKPNKKGANSILNRLGEANDGKKKDLGTKVLVRNLKFNVLEDEVKELFGTVGKISKAEIVYDKSGRSKGMARVWFARRADAEKAIKQYDGRTLDNQPMSIALDDKDDRGNVRNGLFGTALGGRHRDDVQLNVSLGNKSSGRRRRNRGNRGNGMDVDMD